MADTFDPDAYLQEKASSDGGGFDPDAYLAKAAPDPRSAEAFWRARSAPAGSPESQSYQGGFFEPIKGAYSAVATPAKEALSIAERGVPEAAITGAGATLQSLAVGQRPRARAFAERDEIVKRIQAGETPEDAIAAVRAAPPPTPSATTMRPYQAGTALKEYAKEKFPLTQEERESLPGQASSMIGGILPAMLATSVAGPAGVVAGGLQFGAASAGDTFEKALQVGATEDDAAAAAGLSGAMSAAIGMIPLSAVLTPIKQLSPGLMGWAAAKLSQAGLNGVVFTGVGEAQHYLNTEIEKAYFDPKASYDPDFKRMLASALVGGGFGVAHPLRGGEPAPSALAPRPAEEAPVASAPAEAPPPSGPVDMAQLERGIEAPPTGAGVPEPPPFAFPREGLDPNVRVMSPEVPHSLRPTEMQDSVGAQRAQTAISQMLPETRKFLGDELRKGYNENTIEDRIEEMSTHEGASALDDHFSGLAGGLYANPGQARVEIGQFFRQREKEAQERINNSLDRNIGENINRTEWENNLKASRKREGAPFWKQFDETAIPLTEPLKEILERPTMKRVIRKANDALKDRGLPASNGFEDELGKEVRVPTARAFQLAKMAIDDKIGAAIRAGKRNAALQFTTLKNDLLTAIDNHPDPSVRGVWKEARENWATPTELMEARKLGQDILKSGVHETEVPMLLAGMSAAERLAVLYGIRNHFSDIAGRAGPTELKQIKEGLSGSNRSKLAAVLGDDRANELFSDFEHEYRMHFGGDRIIRNSITGQVQLYRKMWSPEGGDKAGEMLEELPGAIKHPWKTAARKVLEKTVARQAAKQRELWKQIRDESGRYFTMQGPEFASATRALLRDNGETPPPSRPPRGPGGPPWIHGPEPAEAASRSPSTAFDFSPGVKAQGIDAADNLKKQWAIESPIKTIDDLFSEAEKNQDDLGGVGENIANDLGVEFRNPGIKERKRTQEKIDEGKPPSRINDVVRAGFSVDVPDQAEAVVARLAEHYPIIDEGWAVTQGGYFDRKVIIRFPNGQGAEVQIWHPDLLRAKEEKGGHKFYVQARTLKAGDPRKAEIEQEMADSLCSGGCGF